MTRTKQERRRLIAVYTVVFLSFAVFVARLLYFQVGCLDRYSEVVRKQSTGRVTIPAPRGVVYDRNGDVVAHNVIRYSLYAYPQSQEEMQTASAYVSRLFKMSSETVKKKFKFQVNKTTWIARQIPDSLADLVELDNPEGLYLRKDQHRSYPYGTIGKQVLGFTDIDNKGQSGFELVYDSLLSGTEGFADIRRDGLRNTYRVTESALVPPIPGQSVVLTIDWRFQEIVEQELRHAVDTFNAKWGMAAFLDCETGEILAVSHFDPSEKNPDKPTKLRAVSDQFEPGSVFKAFTAACVLEDGKIDINSLTYCENGVWKLGRRTLHDDHKHGWLTFREIMEKSSNIGIAKHCITLGGNELLAGLKNFGFGKKLKIGFPGEAGGRLVSNGKWSDYTISALSMGHAVAVTPLQLASGFAAIANGGELIRPRLVLGQVDEHGVVTRTGEREVISRVMKESTSALLRDILPGVVERGTAEAVKSKIVAIAGKTGTAEVPDHVNKRYFKNKFVASFAGYFPVDNPRVAGIVVLQEPEPIHYGGYTSGPAFRRIAERMVLLEPDRFGGTQQILAERSKTATRSHVMPDLIGRQLAGADAIAHSHGLMLRCAGERGTVNWQYPTPGTQVYPGTSVVVALSDGTPNPAMLDMTGLPIRSVSAFLQFAGVSFAINGRGSVVSQSVAPGELLTSDTVCRLECSPL
jgi:cell division protein FtsI (penicillin-binding protein 3)